TPTAYTYGEFSEFIDRVAAHLHSRYGIRAGGSVATLTVNQPLTVAIYFAAWRLGARVVPINPSEADDRVGYIVKNSEATVLIANRACREDYAGVVAQLESTVQRTMVGIAESGKSLPAGWSDFEEELKNTKP